jgi:hypothetical protein
MRVPGLTLAGVLALTAPIVVHALPLEGKTGSIAKGAAPGVVQVWGGCGPGWRPVAGHWSRWRGEWVPPHCAPNNHGGSWGGPYPGQANPYNWGAYSGWQQPYGGGYDYGRGWRNP